MRQSGRVAAGPRREWDTGFLPPGTKADDGRYTLRGGVSYAASGDSYEAGGGVSLEVRFRPGAAARPHGAAFARQGKGRFWWR